MSKKYDFGGYATKYDLRCADGLTINQGAFAHTNGITIPLVWQHCHNDPDNILGKATLEHRADGVYAYCSFSDTEKAQNAKKNVKHGAITNLSIFANSLTKKGANVVHGDLIELSLVLAGANKGALIDQVSFSHGIGTYAQEDETEALIYTGLPIDIFADDKQDNQSIKHSELPSDLVDKTPTLSPEEIELLKTQLKHESNSGDKTVEDVLNTFNDDQKAVLYALIAQAISDSGSASHSSIEGETFMKKNMFDTAAENSAVGTTLSHSQVGAILHGAQKCGSLKDSFLAHVAEYGLDPIDILFPEARNVRTTPDLIKREDSWVNRVLDGATKTPFSRIRSTAANLTGDEARARGFTKGNRKIEEIIPLLKRVTTPTTIYKKQKLDRDDIIDITDFDVVVWLKSEMRDMLNEELARAILIGDGRAVDSDDKIKEEHIRPIWTDDELYAPKVTLPADIKTLDMIDEITKARNLYRGSGVPEFYTTTEKLTEMLLVRDSVGRKIYPTFADLSAALRVRIMIEVEVMENSVRTIGTGPDAEEVELIGIMTNIRDYTIGADRGGQVSMFDDFDIDYNQHKYLIETRVSGALTRPKSAVVIEKKKPKAVG